jgi:hypothetical protein
LFYYIPIRLKLKTYSYMILSEYIKNVNHYFKIGISKENAYCAFPDSVIFDNVLQSPDADPLTKKVKINNDQYFGKVPLKAWNFNIGGYQPAEKWLIGHRDCTLTMDEIHHCQKIIVSLMEADRVIEIEK